MKQAAIFVALASAPLVSGQEQTVEPTLEPTHEPTDSAPKDAAVKDDDNLVPMGDVMESLYRLERMMIMHGEDLDEIKEDLDEIREDLNEIEEDLDEIEEGVDDIAEEVEDIGQSPSKESRDSDSAYGRESDDDSSYSRESDSWDTQEESDSWEPESPSSKDTLEEHLEDQLERRDMDVDELKDRAEKVFEVVADQKIKDFISEKSEVDTPQERYVLGMELISACLDEMPHDVLLDLVESSLNKRVSRKDRRLVVDTLGPLRDEFATLPLDERRRKAWWEYLIEGLATVAEIALEIFGEDSSSSD